MISTKLVLLAASALAAPAAAAAPEPSNQAPANAVLPHPDALAIAGLMLPVEAAVEASVRIGKQAFLQMFKSNPEIAELESALPGISDALWPALEPEIRRFTKEEHPGYLNMVASFYTSRFTPDELKALHTLYATPTGTKIINAMYSDARPGPMIEEMIRAPDAQVSVAAANETMREQTGRLVQLLTKEDQAPIQAALQVVPLAKLERANAALSELVVQWLNRPTPELDARVDAAMEKAMTRYMAEHPPKP
jgi:hypothetical protein